MDQPVLELETDKATIEVPSSVAGTVGEIKVKQGDKVKVGQVILTVTESKAGGQEGRKAETQGGKAEGQQGKAEGQQGKVEGQQGKVEGQEGQEDAVGANTAAKVPDDEPGLEQHVEGNRRDTGGDKPGTTRGTRDAAADSLPSAAASAQQARPAPSRQSGNVVDISRGARQPAE